MITKAVVRMAAKERLARMTENDRRIESQIVVRELRKILGDRPCCIGAYLPFADEPDIRPLLEELVAAGWSVGIPDASRVGMVFRSVRSLRDVTKDPVTGIPTPPAGSEIDAKIETVLVPGRAFTAKGMRIGRGSGGYDRWLARHPQIRSIGVCFDCQLLPEIPEEAHDRRVDIVLTATQCHRTMPKGADGGRTSKDMATRMP